MRQRGGEKERRHRRKTIVPPSTGVRAKNPRRRAPPTISAALKLTLLSPPVTGLGGGHCDKGAAISPPEFAGMPGPGTCAVHLACGPVSTADPHLTLLGACEYPPTVGCPIWTEACGGEALCWRAERFPPRASRFQPRSGFFSQTPGTTQLGNNDPGF